MTLAWKKVNNFLEGMCNSSSSSSNSNNNKVVFGNPIMSFGNGFGANIVQANFCSNSKREIGLPNTS